MSGRPQDIPRRAWFAVAVITAMLGGVAVADAHFDSSATAAPSISSLTVGNPGSATAATTDGCATVTISWTAASVADAYRVQYSADSGAWTDLVVETGNVTQITDTLGHPGATITYRVYGRDADSNWEGSTPAVSNSLTCP